MTTAATPPKAATSLPSFVELVELRRIPLAELHESPHNPRQRYDDMALKELAASLLQTGQLTPIIVRPRKGGGYEIAAGHRRYRAAVLAVKQQPDGAKYRGVDALEAKVVVLDDRAFIEVLNVENLQRDDLHPIEEAQGFRDLMTEAGYDVAKIAARVGRSTRYVYDSLTLLKLTPQGKKLFLDGAFQRGHAILLARLTPEQQTRAIGDLKEVVNGGSYSLLLRPDGGAEDQDDLPLHDQVKPVSVREFQKAIEREIRATPEQVDPFLFPESAAALVAAKEETLSVIHITREYLASDEVRQAGEERVFGSQAWERADGQAEPEDHDYLGRRRKPVKSKTCDWSRYGFVVCGPGQGEVFKVCINKQKCKVHWPEHVKRAEEAKKRAKKTSSSGSAEKREKAEAATEARRQQELQEKKLETARWAKARPAILAAVAAKIRTLPAGATSAIADEVLNAVMDGARKPNTTLPRGRSAEDFVRFAALQLYVRDVEELDSDYWRDDSIKNLKALGIDPARIVDQVAPKPTPEQKPAKKKAKKGSR